MRGMFANIRFCVVFFASVCLMFDTLQGYEWIAWTLLLLHINDGALGGLRLPFCHVHRAGWMPVLMCAVMFLFSLLHNAQTKQKSIQPRTTIISQTPLSFPQSKVSYKAHRKICRTVPRKALYRVRVPIFPQAVPVTLPALRYPCVRSYRKSKMPPLQVFRFLHPSVRTVVCL